MEFLSTINIIDLFTNLEQFIRQLIQEYPRGVYLILFAIVCCETGLVIMPILPGDSLLFFCGYCAAGSGLDLAILLPVFCAAPIVGDSLNYWIGRFVGPKIFHKEKVRFLNKEHLNQAHKFYEKHGGKAVAIGRFMPIIRTFVPFVAGIGRMNYGRFLAFSITGTLAWIHLFVLAGYFFGGLPFIKKHFEMVIVLIIVISLLPAVLGYLKSRRAARKTADDAQLISKD